MGETGNQGEIGAVLAESWSGWAKATASVLARIDADDGAGLAGSSEAELWAAEAVSSRYAESEMGVHEARRRSNPLGFLLRRAVKLDASAALAHLMTRPAALAARGEGPESFQGQRLELARAAREAKAEKCLALICLGGAEFAWRVAEMCMPSEDSADSSVKIAWKGARGKAEVGWAAGYSAALEAVRAAGPWALDERARKALARGLLFDEAWRGAPERNPGAMALGRAQAIVEGAGARGRCDDVIGPLLIASCAPGPQQRAAWELVKSIPKGLWPTDPSGAFDSVALGVAARSEVLPNQSSAEFGQSIDPAWVCAGAVRDEQSARIAFEMAEFFEKAREARPQVSPSVASMEHPLAPVWAVWTHSRRAGKALPDKPLGVALSRMKKSLSAWGACVGEASTAPWGRAGAWVLDELKDGKVPANFPGFDTEPKAIAAARELSHAMSPAAWRYDRSDMDEQMFGWRALAASRLGFSISESVAQLRGDWGLRVKPAWVALAEERELSELVAAPKSEPRRGPRI